MPWLSLVISNILLASLLALAAWCVQRWLQKPATARMLWILALVKLVTPPMVSVPLVELPGAVACSLGACGCPGHAGSTAIVLNTFLWVLLAAWLGGAGATAWVAWRRWTRFRELVIHARPAPREWQTLAARLSAELSLPRSPEILAVPGRLPPLVVASWRRSRLLLPMALMDQLSDSQRVALLLHELVHIKRRDHWVRLLELAVSVAYWWLPVVGAIGRQLRMCEETCCDAAVVARRPQERREYARLLLDVVDFANPLPRNVIPQATAMSAANDLERRLRAILDATRKPRAWSMGAVLAVGVACAILPCELKYDFGGRRAPAASPAEHDPAGDTCRLPSGPSTVHHFSVGCPA
jgi:beta-lactamase regulating signal transducer with metallopeptidase domain